MPRSRFAEARVGRLHRPRRFARWRSDQPVRRHERWNPSAAQARRTAGSRIGRPCRRTIQRLIARYQLQGAVDPEGEGELDGENEPERPANGL